jgi:nicotinamidase-related amidase
VVAVPVVSLELDLPTLPTEVSVPAKRTAVLVVDLQNESCHPDGRTYTIEGGEAARASAELVDRARAEGCPVIWLRSMRRPEQPLFSVFGVTPYKLQGTWNVEIAEPLKPAGDEPVFDKFSHDCFYQTGLDNYLQEHGILGPEWTFVVTGVSFAACAYIAATGLSVRDYRVVVPMDCVAPRTGPKAAMSISRLTDRGYAFNVTLVESSAGLRFER